MPEYPVGGGAPGLIADGTIADSKLLGVAKRPGALWVALGDSTTAGADTEYQFNGGSTSYYSESWVTYTVALLLGRMTRVKNVGIPGQTSTQIAARFGADVTPLAPSVVTILAGTNDLAAGTFATFQANITAMVASCRAISAVPVLVTMCPSNAQSHAKVNAWNAWLHRYATQQGLVLLDFFAQLVDYTTGNYQAALSGDGVHPNPAGLALLAQYVANNLGPMLPFVSAPLCGDDTDPDNLLAHGLFNGAVSGGVSAGWNSYGGPIVGSNYSVTTLAGILGKVQQLQTVATAANAYLNQNIPNTKFAAGDRLLITGLFTWTGSGTIRILVNYNGGAPGSSTPLLVGQPITLGRFYQEFVVPAGTSSIDFFMQVAAGTATAQIGQATVYNLTQLGIL